MEIFTDIPKLQYKELPRYEPIVKDSSSIMTYKECPRKFFFRYVLGYTEKNKPQYFSFGGAYHLFREKLEVYYAENKKDKKLDFELLINLSYMQAVQDATKYWKEESKGQVIGGKYDFLNLGRLNASFTLVKEHWKNEKQLGQIEVIATEQPFNFGILDTQVNKIYYIGGRFDQIIKWGTKLWGRDFKSSSKTDAWFSRLLKPNHQFITYTVAQSELHGKNIQGQLVELLQNDAKNGPTLYLHPVSFTDEEFDLWRKEVTLWLRRIDQSREEDNYPANESHCSYCPFHLVCKNNPTERGRINELKHMYKIELWDFTQEDYNKLQVLSTM